MDDPSESIFLYHVETRRLSESMYHLEIHQHLPFSLVTFHSRFTRRTSLRSLLLMEPSSASVYQQTERLAHQKDLVIASFPLLRKLKLLTPPSTEPTSLDEESESIMLPPVLPQELLVESGIASVETTTLHDVMFASSARPQGYVKVVPLIV